MIVLVTGGRGYSDVKTLESVLDREHATHSFRLLVHGCATGADTLSAIWAMKRGIHPAGIPALWDFYGRAEAGPARNSVMLIIKPELVIAFPGGRGTANMVWQAHQADIPVIDVDSASTPLVDGGGPVVEGAAICLEQLCGWKGPISAPTRAAFTPCPACGSPAGFMYRGGQKVSA